MVVFVDTSGMFASVDRDDPNHVRAREGFRAALAARDRLMVHSYILVEAIALLARRRGWEAVERFLAETGMFEVRWVDEALHRAAVERFIERKGKFSLVDEVSFLVIQEASIRHALAFDRHFWEEGFFPYPA